MKKLLTFILLLTVANLITAQTGYVNGFALGTNGISVDISNLNLNNVKTGGFYRGYALGNAPDGGWWYVLVEVHDGTWVKQTVTAFSASNIYPAGTTFIRNLVNNVWTGWSRVLLENSQGLVGIGTTSPSFKLHVSNGTVYVDPGANNGFKAGSYLTMGNMNLGNSPFISFNATLTTSNIATGQNLFTPAYGAGSGLIIQGDAGGSGLHFLQKNYNGNAGEANLNSFNEVVTLDQAGKLGIGTTNPNAALDVARLVSDGSLGTVMARMAEGNTSGDGTYLGVKGWGTQQAYNGKSFSIEHSFYGQKNSAINFYRGGGITGGYITFETNNGTERMRIDEFGNIGIATIPQASYKLSVNGTIGARKIKVTQETWADYVFAPEYKLLPLQDLETYIKQHQHLPDVPSAIEVAKDGIDLGDNQVILLKKIEELFLYMIDLKKENTELRKRVNKLELKN